MEKVAKRKRRLGDRYDGYRIKTGDPMFGVIPHIMRSRLDCQVFFEEPIDISHIREFILEHRGEMPGLSAYHLFVAAVLRTIAQKPRLNRFVSGRKIYARSYIRASLTVKTSRSEDADEAVVMPEFAPTDTLYEVVQRFNDHVKEAKRQDDAAKGNDTDILVKILNSLPGFVLKFVVWAIRSLDSFGMMPKIINRLSPFHSSIFVTNVGSIGINSVYHHLYEFGTTSMFMAIGKKETVRELQSDGSVDSKTIINTRFVLDERICDGHYYATAIKLFKYYMKNLELLLLPPDYVKEDI